MGIPFLVRRRLEHQYAGSPHRGQLLPVPLLLAPDLGWGRGAQHDVVCRRTRRVRPRRRHRSWDDLGWDRRILGSRRVRRGALRVGQPPHNLGAFREPLHRRHGGAALLAAVFCSTTTFEILRISAFERRIKAETELLRANNQLKSIDAQKTSFFQNVSHELRTPLTLILPPLDEAIQARPEDTQMVMAARNARRLLRLVNQLLDLQKLRAGRRPSLPSPSTSVDFCSSRVMCSSPRAPRRTSSLRSESTTSGIQARTPKSGSTVRPTRSRRSSSTSCRTR